MSRAGSPRGIIPLSELQLKTHRSRVKSFSMLRQTKQITPETLVLEFNCQCSSVLDASTRNANIATFFLNIIPPSPYLKYAAQAMHTLAQHPISRQFPFRNVHCPSSFMKSTRAMSTPDFGASFEHLKADIVLHTQALRLVPARLDFITFLTISSVLSQSFWSSLTRSMP